MDAELERRYANVRAAMAEHELDALIVSGSEYTGFEGSVTYLSGFQIVHRYAYVVVPADGEPQIVFPTEARYVGEHGTAQLEQVFHDRPGEHIAATARDRRLAPDRRLRARLRHGRARLPRARGPRPRPVRRRVRPRARGQERGGARVGARERPHQRGRLRGVPRRLRAGRDRGRGDGAGGGALRRARLRPADDEHGPGRARVRRSHAARRALGDFVLPSLEIAGPGDALGRGLARARRRRRPRSSRWSRPTTSTTPPRGRRCATARPRTTSTAPSRRDSPSAATTSATSPATRSG